MRLESEVQNTFDSRYSKIILGICFYSNTLLIGFYVANQEIDLLNIVISKNLSKRVITKVIIQLREQESTNA